MSYPPGNDNTRVSAHSQQVPPNTPIYKEYGRAIARDQDDLQVLERLVTRLGDLDVSDRDQPSVPRRPYSASGVPREGTRFSLAQQLHRPSSVPVNEKSGRNCSYVHPVIGKTCGAWYSGDMDEHFDRHVAQHYLEEMAFRAKATIDHLEHLRTRYSGLFQESQEYVFTCSCGTRASRRTTNPARLFLLDPDRRNSMCHTCLIQNILRVNNDIPPPYYKRREL